jgi:hypothetical protein
MNICGDISSEFGLKNAEHPQVMAFKQIGNHGDVTSHQIRGYLVFRQAHILIERIYIIEPFLGGLRS